MPPVVPLSESTRRAVERSFPPQAREAVVKELIAVSNGGGGDRVCGAILALAFGELDRSKQLAAQAREDFRDVLIQLDWPEGDLTRPELARRYEALGLPVPAEVSGITDFTLEAVVKWFLAEELIARYDDLRASARLQQDLGVNGARGRGLIAAFAERFGVYLGAFQAEQPFDSPSLIQRLLRLRPAELQPISVGDLAKAACAKRWPP